MDLDAAVVLAGSLLAATAAVSVALLQIRHARRERIAVERAERLAEFAAAAWALANAIGTLAYAPSGAKVDREVEARAAPATELNRRVSAIRLLESDAVVAAADAVDAQLVTLFGRARERTWARDEWLADGTLRERISAFHAVARQELHR